MSVPAYHLLCCQSVIQSPSASPPVRQWHQAGSRSSVPPKSPKGLLEDGARCATAARHLRRGPWKQTVPVERAASTKLPAGGAHLDHSEIQDLTSESTSASPPCKPCPPLLAATPFPASQST